MTRRKRLEDRNAIGQVADLSQHRIFARTLRRVMVRPTYHVTPGLLARLSGVSKATIVNWIEDRVVSPRSADSLEAISDALRLDELERAALFAAAGLTPSGVPKSRPAFDEVPVGLYSTTIDGRILSANATLIAMLEYDETSYYGLDVARDLYLDASQRERWLAEIAATTTVFRWPLVAKTSGGAPIHLLDTCRAVYDVYGRFVRFDGMWERSSRRDAVPDTHRRADDLRGS